MIYGKFIDSWHLNSVEWWRRTHIRIFQDNKAGSICQNNDFYPTGREKFISSSILRRMVHHEYIVWVNPALTKTSSPIKLQRDVKQTRTFKCPNIWNCESTQQISARLLKGNIIVLNLKFRIFYVTFKLPIMIDSLSIGFHGMIFCSKSQPQEHWRSL